MGLDKKYVVLLILVLLLAFGVRVHNLDSDSLWVDEAISLRQADRPIVESVEYVKSDIHLPIYVICLNVWIDLFGTSEFAVRFLSVIYGVISVLVLFFLANVVYGKKTALLSSLFLSLSNLHIYYSKEARPYSLFILLTIMSFLFYLKYFKTKEKSYLIFYLISSVLLLYTHIFSFLIFFVQSLHFLIYNCRCLKNILSWSIVQFCLFLSFVPWLPVLINQINDSGHYTWITSPGISKFIEVLVGLFGNYYVLAVFMILLIGYLVLNKKECFDNNNSLFFMWVFLPLVLMLILSQIIPLFHVRYFLFLIPAYCILYSVVIFSVFKRRMFVWFGIFFVVSFSFTSIIYYDSNITRDDWKGVTEYLKQNVGDSDIVFINPYYQQDAFLYYYSNDCFLDEDIYGCSYHSHNVVSIHIDERDCCVDKSKLTYGGNLIDVLDNKIYFVSVRENEYDSNSSVFNYLTSNKKLTDQINFKNEVVLYVFN